jgi:hypothetical protein
MDKTTLTLAVDSTQVNTAAAALSKMASEGYKAETVAVRVANAATQQGKALATMFGKGASDAAAAVKALTGATSSLAAGQDFSKTAASLSASANQAKSATAAVQALGAAIAESASIAPAAAPKAPTQTKLVNAVSQPVSVIDRNAGVTINAQPVTAATTALGKMADQAAKTRSATDKLTEAAQAQGAALDASVATGAEKATAALGDMSKASTAASYAVPGAGVVTSVSAAAAKQAEAAGGQSTGGAAQLAQQAGAVGDAASKSVKGVDDLTKSAKAMAQQHQIAAIQVKDFVEQIISGGSPMRAFAQQGLAVVSTYGGFKAALSGIASLITPFRIGVAAGVTALGAFGLAQYQASQQSKAFKDATTLAGNYAGQTEAQIGAMANRIAETTKTSVSSVREMATALAGTGQIGPQAFDAATEAAVRLQKATGKTADDVAATFAQLAQNPLKFADELNKSGNVFTAADRDAIKSLQDQGKVEDAQALVLDKWASRLKSLQGNVGDFGRLLDEVKTKASQFWDFLGHIKLPTSVMAAGAGFTGDAPIMPPSLASAAASEVEAQRQEEEEKARKDREQAAKDAEAARVRQRGTAAAERLDDLNIRANPAEAARKTRDLFNKDVADAAASGKAYTPAQIARMRLQNTLDTTDPRILQNASVNYSTQVQKFKDALESEQQALSFFNQYQQGQYQAGAVSLEKFYDDKVESIRKGTSAEISELDKEKAATQQLLKSVVDPAQRAELLGRIARYDTQKKQAADKGNFDERLTQQEREAAQRAMADQVDNFRANIAQASGNEFGAAQIRAQTTERQNRIFAGQTGGQVSEDDVKRLTALSIAQAKYQDIQTRSGFVAQSTARAEEAANLVAEQSGKSLLETENDIYAVREKAVAQLGKLKDEMAALAAVSTDPKIKQAAADLALQYANAVAKMDPALQRLRDAQKSLASDIANSINSGISNLPEAYSQRRQDAAQQVKDEKDLYDRRIEIQEGYLAQAATLEDKARIRKKIADLQAQKDAVQGESKAHSLLQSINTSFIQPIAGQVTQTFSKLLITDPLQKQLENTFKSLSEGDGMFAGLFKGAMGIKDPKTGALDAQTAAVQASTTALDALSTAASSAANAVRPASAGAAPGSPGAAASSSAAPNTTPLSQVAGQDQASAAADPEATQAIADARKAVDGMGATADTASSAVTALASAAGKGGSALSIFPSLLNMIASAASTFVASLTASSAASGAGSNAGFWASLFGSSGSGRADTAYMGSAATSSAPSSYIFHDGGVVGGSGVVRPTPPGIFAGAVRYHTGGVVGQKPDGSPIYASDTLKSNEVPAILMGGPKGTREEVLHATDPRHRDNLGVQVFQQIMKGEKPWVQPAANQAAAKAAEAAPPANAAVSVLLRHISGSQQTGDSSATVLAGLLGRLGVKEGQDLAAGAIPVAGARASGGPVSAGQLYQVNERGPELLDVAGKQYLMMGAQGGSVTPNNQLGIGGGGQRPIQQTINFYNNGPIDRRTQAQLAAATYSGAARHSARNN